jgi:DTW domain-containing protein YfiP
MRPTCPNCLRPKAGCICHLISKVHSDAEVLILQHPLEVAETKGTARLLHLCLPNSRILVGEIFENAVFNDELFLSKKSILLYPTTAEDHSLGITPPPVLETIILNDLKDIRLIIIDGTWRKSRKILCKNPYLQTLPRLVLQDLPLGQYTIRKARKPHQLSTLEATSAALMQLDQAAQRDSAKYAPLMQAFMAFNTLVGSQMRR